MYILPLIANILKLQLITLPILDILQKKIFTGES